MIGRCAVVWIAVSIAMHPAATTAASLEPRDLRQIVAASSDIVHATALASTCRWNQDHTLIVTETRLRVHEAFKGTAASEILVTTPGGKIGKLLVEVPGTAPFRPGEECILFLVTVPTGTKSVEGLSRGRFEIVVDGRTGQRVVSPGLAAQLAEALRTPGERKAAAQRAKALDVARADLHTLVRDVEAKGGR